MKALLRVAVLATIAGPVAADDFTGSEKEMRTLNCPRGGQVPADHEPPGPGECEGTATTYQGYVYTNNVKCKSGGAASQQGVNVYHNQSGTTSGGVGVCNDGSTAPVQGRAVAQGSEKGGNVYVDGDKDNSNATAQGWARVDGTFDGKPPSYRCGNDNGRKDASEPTSADTSGDCG